MKDIQIDIEKQKEGVNAEAQLLLKRKSQTVQTLQEIDASLFRLEGKMQVLERFEEQVLEKPAAVSKKK